IRSARRSENAYRAAQQHARVLADADSSGPLFHGLSVPASNHSRQPDGCPSCDFDHGLFEHRPCDKSAAGAEESQFRAGQRYFLGAFIVGYKVRKRDPIFSISCLVGTVMTVTVPIYLRELL